MKKNIFKSIILFSILILTGCVTSTAVNFNSNVPGVEIIVDGKRVGETPCSATISNAIWKEHSLIAKKDGYEIRQISLDCEVKITNIVFGALLWYPSFFWCYGPKENQYIVMFEDEKTPVMTDKSITRNKDGSFSVHLVD